MLCSCVAKLRGRLWAAVAFGIALCAVSSGAEPRPARDVLSPEQWRRLDAAVDHGLEYLSTQQRPDGSFQAPDQGQPGITSLCVLAFLSRGHVPAQGPYGDQLSRAIEYVLDTGQENGLLFDLPVAEVWRKGTPTHAAIYNHGIAGLMLGEVYGMTDEPARTRIAAAITSAIEFTRQTQLRPKRNRLDQGAWRYLGRLSGGLRSDADLSVTVWQLMFLRSARNAEFRVPAEYIDEAMEYVRGAYRPSQHDFTYCRIPPGNRTSRAMTGSGILSLSLAGEHQSEMARSAGAWILRNGFERYGEVYYYDERYLYSVYYCSPAMFQLGGEYWSRFFPPLQRVLLEHQQDDGSWPRELPKDGQFGNCYSTALVVLSLTPPYQLLPIYQR